MPVRISRSTVRETAGQLLRFGMATGLSATISLGLPILLHEALHVEQKIAVAISQATVLLMNFITLRLFVFRGSGSVRGDLMRYFGIAAVFSGIEYLSFLALFELAGLFYLTALVITLIVSTVIKFVLYRYIFGRSDTVVA